MKLTIEIDTGDKASLQSLYDVARAMMGISGDAPAKPASPPKAAATTAPSASTTTAPTPPAASSTTTASTPTPAAPSGETADLPTAQKAFQDYVKANGPAKAKAIIAEFGVASLAAMPAEQYGAFVARLAA